MDRDQLVMESAKVLLPFIASLDPLWRESIDVMRAERGFDDLQCIGALVGYTLEQQAHMWIPRHPFFSDTHMAAGSRRECPECHQEWIVAYPGQPVCSNLCAATYHARKNRAEEEAHGQEEHAAQSSRPSLKEIRARKVQAKTLTAPSSSLNPND